MLSLPASVLAVGLSASLVFPLSSAVGGDPADEAYVVVDLPGDGVAFGTTTTAGAVVDALPEPYTPPGTAAEPIAAEVVDGVGYALAPEWIEDVFTTALLEWDPETGAVDSGLTISFDAESLLLPEGATDIRLDRFAGLDIGSEGELLTVACVSYVHPDSGYACVLGALDRSTAQFAGRVVLGLDPSSRPDAIVTDPSSGAILLLRSRFLPALGTTAPLVRSVVGADPGTWETMSALVDPDTGLFPDGASPSGADAAADGTLWIGMTSSTGERHLLSYAPGADLVESEPGDAGVLTPSAPGGAIAVAFSSVLTVAQTTGGVVPAPGPQPELAATGVTIAPGLVVAGVLTLVLGAVLVSSRRRRAMR